MIIQIALGCQCVPLSREDLGHELFGRCFAIAAGNADDLGRKPPPVPGCQVLERGQGIIHADAH